MRILVWISIVLASACSGVQFRSDAPSEAVATPPLPSACSLGLTKARSALSRNVEVLGFPVLLILRDTTLKGPGRVARSGDRIYFHVPSARSTTNTGSSGNPSIMDQWDVPRSTSPPATWIVEDRSGSDPRAVPGTPLVDGAIVVLRRGDGSGYLTLPTSPGELARAAGDEGTRIILRKADFPDPNHPGTCDARVRDGDYVFIQAAPPSIWLGLSADGVPALQPIVSGRDGHRPLGVALCGNDEEHCHTDSGGGVVCAWQPRCTDSP